MYCTTMKHYLDDVRMLWEQRLETDLLSILNLWPRWTPLLPYALQEVLNEVHRWGNGGRLRFDELRCIMSSTCFRLHFAICDFQKYDTYFAHRSTDLTFLNHHICACVYYHETNGQLIDECVEEIGWDMFCALSHGLLTYLNH